MTRDDDKWIVSVIVNNRKRASGTAIRDISRWKEVEEVKWTCVKYDKASASPSGGELPIQRGATTSQINKRGNK
jgi:hypothetical protein